MTNIFLIWLSVRSSLLLGTTSAADTKATLDLYAAYAMTGVGSASGGVEVNGTHLAIDTFNERGGF